MNKYTLLLKSYCDAGDYEIECYQNNIDDAVTWFYNHFHGMVERSRIKANINMEKLDSLDLLKDEVFKLAHQIERIKAKL